VKRAAWHFVADTLRDGRPVPKDGVWLEHTGYVRMCETGLHASLQPFDALQFAPGPVPSGCGRHRSRGRRQTGMSQAANCRAHGRHRNAALLRPDASGLGNTPVGRAGRGVRLPHNWRRGDKGRCEGRCVGRWGRCVGRCVGRWGRWGRCEGRCVGRCVGRWGRCEGRCEGRCVGRCVGRCEGRCVGRCEGRCAHRI
jgi:hypothetical protein